jgi:AcrR family transcriptional regulator
VTDSSVESERVYGGVSAHERRDQRRQRLIDAGLELFGTRGVAAVGIGDICAEAGLIKRYFYENFRSIDHLATAVFEQVTDRLVEQVVPAIVAGGGTDPRPALTAYVNGALADPRAVRLDFCAVRLLLLLRFFDFRLCLRREHRLKHVPDPTIDLAQKVRGQVRLRRKSSRAAHDPARIGVVAD